MVLERLEMERGSQKEDLEEEELKGEGEAKCLGLDSLRLSIVVSNS